MLCHAHTGGSPPKNSIRMLEVVWVTYPDQRFVTFQVIRLVLLNMFLHVAWALKSIDIDNPDENMIKTVLSKRDVLMEQLQSILNSLLDSWQQDNARSFLTSTV